MEDASERYVPEVFSWELVRRNMKAATSPRSSWWLGEGDEYHWAQQAKGLVLAQMAEVEAVLFRAATIVFGVASPSDAHVLARRRLLDRRAAGALVEDIRAALVDRGTVDIYKPQLRRLVDALKRRNELAHGSIEVRGAGDYERPDGTVEWCDGDIYLGGKECGRDQLEADLHAALAATIAAIELLSHLESS